MKHIEHFSSGRRILQHNATGVEFNAVLTPLLKLTMHMARVMCGSPLPTEKQVKKRLIAVKQFIKKVMNNNQQGYGCDLKNIHSISAHIHPKKNCVDIFFSYNQPNNKTEPVVEYRLEMSTLWSADIEDIYRDHFKKLGEKNGDPAGLLHPGVINKKAAAVVAQF